MSNEQLGVNIEDEDEKTLVDRFNQGLKVEKSSATIIDPDGDVILQLADAKLQVSSKVLSVASKVWKAMFSPKYSEGQVHTEDQPRCIPHLDDDTQTMITLCLVLHHKGYWIAEHPDINKLVKLTVLADKYDCAEAVAYYGCTVLGGLTRAMDASGLPNDQLLFPALFFDDQYTFERVTRMMVYTKTPAGQIASFTTKRYNIPRDIRNLLPQELLEFLSAKEQAIKGELLEKIENLVKASTDILAQSIGQNQTNLEPPKAKNRNRKTGCNCLRVAVLTKNLSDLEVLPIAKAMTNARLADVCESLSRLPPFGYIPLPTFDEELPGSRPATPFSQTPGNYYSPTTPDLSSSSYAPSSATAGSHTPISSSSTLTSAIYPGSHTVSHAHRKILEPVSRANRKDTPDNTPSALGYQPCPPTFSPTSPSPREDCPTCKEGFYKEVGKMRKQAETAFKGLCLDCFNDNPCPKVGEVLHFCGKDM